MMIRRAVAMFQKPGYGSVPPGLEQMAWGQLNDILSEYEVRSLNAGGLSQLSVLSRRMLHHWSLWTVAGGTSMPIGQALAVAFDGIFWKA